MIREPEEVIVTEEKSGESVEVSRVNEAERSRKKIKTERITFHLGIWSLLVTFLKANFFLLIIYKICDPQKSTVPFGACHSDK